MRVEFWADRRGNEPVREYLAGRSRSGDRGALASFDNLLGRLEREGPVLGMPQSRMIDRRVRLYELRFGPHRIAYAQRGDVVYLLHAWRKRSQKLDERDASTARRRLADLEE